MGPVWPQALIVAVFLAVPGTMLLRRSSVAYELVSSTGHTTSLRARPWARVVIEAALALGAVVAGARIVMTAVTAIDILITLLWLFGCMNAFALLDRYDGMVVGVAAAAALGLFLLAIDGDQQVTAGAAAAMFGACLAFLACKRAPSVSLLGDTGRRSVGFALALLAVEVETVVPPPISLTVPLLLLGLPLLSGAMVSLGRVRRGRRLWADRRDHLYHRLRARGLSPRWALLVPVFGEVVLASLAVVAGRGLVPVWTAAAAGVGALIVIGMVCGRALVHQAEKVGLPRGLRRTMALGAIALVALVGPASVSLALAVDPARRGLTLAQEALASASSANTGPSAARFERARASFSQARARLDSPLASLGLAVPGLAFNLEASRTLAMIGERLSTAGVRLAAMSEVSQLRVANGSVPIADLRRLGPTLAELADLLRSSRDRLTTADWHYLVPSVRRAVDDLTTRLEQSTQAAEIAAEGARALPAMLGAEGARHYFLAFQNTAELRGTGGFIGNWGELLAERGRLRLGRFGRLEDLIHGGGPRRVLDVPPELLDRYRGFDVAGSWQQVNVSPDFPTTARLIGDLYPQSGGRPIDGVVAVDSQGLAALLALTGPVQVPGWPEPITAANVVDVTLRAAYERYPVQEERVEFLGAVSRRVWEAFTSAELGNPTLIARSLGGATRGGHLIAYSEHSEEEGLISRLGADGSVPPLSGDFLMAVNQNVSANKVDLYLRRRLRYHALVDPSSEPARVTGELEIALENGAPADGLPSGVIGPYDDRFQPGENRTYLSLYTPFSHRSATLEGRSFVVDSHPEFGRLAHSATVSIPARTSRTVRLKVEGRVQLEGGNWYRLDLGHQPLVIPDSVDVSIAVPEGWRIAETRGLSRTGSRQASSQVVLDGDRSLFVRVERSGWSGFQHRLFGG